MDGVNSENIKFMLRKFGIEYNEIYYTEKEVKIREHERIKKNIPFFFRKREVTNEMILGLE